MQFNRCGMMIQSVESVRLPAQAFGQGHSVTEHFGDLDGDVCRALCTMGIDTNLLPDALRKKAYDFAPLRLRMLRDQLLPARSIFKREQAVEQRVHFGLLNGSDAHQNPFISRCLRKRARQRPRMNPNEPVASPSSLAISA